jgi:hypothetical protein
VSPVAYAARAHTMAHRLRDDAANPSMVSEYTIRSARAHETRPAEVRSVYVPEVSRWLPVHQQIHPRVVRVQSGELIYRGG